MPVEVIVVGNEDPETVSKEFANDDPVLIPNDVLAATEMVPAVLAAKDPVLLPLEVLPVEISDPELDLAVFVTEKLAEDKADPELVDPLFDSEDPVLTLDHH